MKTILLSLFLICATNSKSQDKNSLQKIDSIVTTINNSKLKITQDSTIQNLPDLGLFIKTYLSMLVDGNNLKKYVNFVKTDRIESGILKQITTCNTFYFFENNLVKVEEIMAEENQVQQLAWYFQNGNCIYHSLQSEKANSRATFLLSMSKELINLIRKTN